LHQLIYIKIQTPRESIVTRGLSFCPFIAEKGWPLCIQIS